MTIDRQKDQLRLDVSQYRVACGDFGDVVVQARSAAAARYQIYKRAREAGFFRAGFRDFLRHGWKAKLIRRAARRQ